MRAALGRIGSLWARSIARRSTRVLPDAFGPRAALDPQDVQHAEMPCVQLVRHQHRQGLLMHEVYGHPAEQALVDPRMSEGAGDDEVGVLRVEAGEQGLDRGQV